MYAGDTTPPFTPQFLDKAGDIKPLTGLAGGAFAIKLQNTKTGVVIVGGGVWTVLDQVNGIAQYQWIAADTQTPGTYDLQVTVTFTTGPETLDHPQPLEIKARF